MPKALTISGMAVAGLVLLLCLLDMTPMKFPFGRPSWVMDIGFLLSAIILGYMSWSTYRELA